MAQHRALAACRRCFGLAAAGAATPVPDARIQRRPWRRAPPPPPLLVLRRLLGGGGVAQMAQQPVPIVVTIVATAKQVPPRRVPLPQPAAGGRSLPDHVQGRRAQLALLVRGVGQGKVLGLGGVQAHDGAADAACHQFPNLAGRDGGHNLAPDHAPRALAQPLCDCRAGEQAEISRGAGGGAGGDNDRGARVNVVAQACRRTAAQHPRSSSRGARFGTLGSLVDSAVLEGIVRNLQSAVAAGLLEVVPIDVVDGRERQGKL